MSLQPEGGGIIRSKIFRSLRFGKSRLIKALVVVSPKFKKPSALRFVGRTIQSFAADWEEYHMRSYVGLICKRKKIMKANEAASEIKNIIERATEQNPQNSEIIKAFGPIITKQRQLAEQPSLEKLDCSLIDKDKLKAGVPVSRQINLFIPEDSWKEIAISLASAVKEGMPQLAENINQISSLIQEGRVNPKDYFKINPDGENKAKDGWEILNISPSNASFLMSLVSRVVLEQRAKEITSLLGAFDWEKGYCPICGSFPSIAMIEEEGGKRFLHCSLCGHDWRFTRVLCPYCENDAKQGMDYFYIEKKTQESAFVCDKCKKYLVTLYRAGNLFVRDMDIAAINLIHLDMIMQDKGYEPMTACAWNVLK